MTEITLVVETENGEQFIGNVKSVDIETEMEHFGTLPTKQHEEYTFNVGSLINVDAGEEH